MCIRDRDYIEKQRDDSASSKGDKWKEQFVVRRVCSVCGGSRLRKEALYFKIDGKMCIRDSTCTIPMRELAGSQKTVRLLLQKAVVGADDRIAYNASLRIKKGSSLSVSGSPGLRISGGISSPDFRVIYGLIDDNFTAGQVDICLLYTSRCV